MTLQRFLASLFPVLAVAAAPAAIAAPELPVKPYLPFDLAQKAAAAAMEACREGGYRVSVAIVDEAGHTKLLLRDDHATPSTVSSSTKKAYTAFSFGQPTGKMVDYTVANPPTRNLQFLDDRTLVLQGGLPIIIDGAKIGGIGVGGAPGGPLDEACAQAGVDAIMPAAE